MIQNMNNDTLRGRKRVILSYKYDNLFKTFLNSHRSIYKNPKG